MLHSSRDRICISSRDEAPIALPCFQVVEFKCCAIDVAMLCSSAPSFFKHEVTSTMH